jgi:hypothetical protein
MTESRNKKMKSYPSPTTVIQRLAFLTQTLCGDE